MPDDHEEEVSDVESEHDYEDLEAGKDEQDHDSDMMAEDLKHDSGSERNGSEVKKPKLDPKDPLRPRRKKARRACFACQRAHLTCGDERPCQRCIKRGLADACQDGVRKKAKYLHDAPPEALRPVLGPNYNPHSNVRNTGPITGGSTSASEASPSGGFFPQQMNSNPSYNHGQLPYQPAPQSTMPPPLQESLSYNSQPSPISPSYTNNSGHRPLSMHGVPSAANGSTGMDIQGTTAFGGPMFDPSNPAFFNFDLEGLNFGNHYGALEFGMLNHMSSGAAETPPNDHHNITGDTGFIGGNSAFNQNLQYEQIYPQQDAMKEFMGIEVDRQNSTGNVFDIQRNHSALPRAYAIETNNSGSAASPSTTDQTSPQSMGFDSSPNITGYQNISHGQGAHGRPAKLREPKQTPKFNHQSLATTKLRRDPSYIYNTVTEPYAYTQGFHALTTFIQRRFSASATLKIAKSLASVRPSFISCTKTLNRQDLIFMEQCFQRTLFEYEDFMRDCSTPTLVCRRTGEVAAVNKEFTLLVGWKEDVLLGKKANLNINTGRSVSQPASALNSLNNSGRAGQATPKLRGLEKGDGKPHSVFLAELMDDDSVVEFYEDFAKLAFGDSRGSVMKRCNLLKYMSKEGLGEDGKEPEKSNGKKRKGNENPILGGRVKTIDAKDGISRLEKDGKMDCTYCWNVKRDVFDMPMLFVMNFLPCIGE